MIEMDAIVSAVREFAVPLLTIDKATIYVVAVSASHVHLHLGGAYSGCAGRAYVEKGLLAPVVASVLPKATLTVTSGLPVPPGAKLITADGDGRSSTPDEALGVGVL